MKKLIVLIIVLTFLTPIFFGCEETVTVNEIEIVEEIPEYGGQLNIGILNNVEMLYPVAIDKREKSFKSLIFEGMVKYDKDLSFIPNLAKGWEISENGLKWIFYLREDVYWHNGEPFNSNDIKFTFELVDQGIIDLDGYQNIAKYEILDENTVSFDLHQPDASFLQTVTLEILPSHIFDVDEDLENQLKSITIGTGPYKLKSWDKNRKEIIISKNDNYYNKKPYIDEIYIKTFPDNEAKKSAFRAGKIDYVAVDTIEWQIYDEIDGIITYSFPNLYYEFIGLNLRNPILENPINRKALIYGIDRERVVREIILDKGRVINSPILDTLWAYNPSILFYEYNPNTAVEMLIENRWEYDEEDTIEDFTLELLINEENENRYKLAQIIKENLGNIGIDVNIELEPWNTVKRNVERKNFDMVISGWKLKPNPDLYYAFHSNEIWGGNNFVSYSNEKVDSLINEARREQNLQKRKEIIFRIQEIINEDLPYIFLYTEDIIYAAKEDIRGVYPDFSGFLGNINNMWIKQ